MPKKTFPGSYKSLKAISEFIIELAEEASFSPSEIYAIQTAVDEACANIIDHAYGGEHIGKIVITASEIQNGLKIILQDKGEAFDPSEVPNPDISSPLEARRERGLGVFFMRQLMDKVTYEFSQKDGNTLVLIKFKGD
jgi:serine/threonine-protein kinase RsbW